MLLFHSLGDETNSLRLPKGISLSFASRRLELCRHPKIVIPVIERFQVEDGQVKSLIQMKFRGDLKDETGIQYQGHCVPVEHPVGRVCHEGPELTHSSSRSDCC